MPGEHHEDEGTSLTGQQRRQQELDAATRSELDAARFEPSSEVAHPDLETPTEVNPEEHAAAHPAPVAGGSGDDDIDPRLAVLKSLNLDATPESAPNLASNSPLEQKLDALSKTDRQVFDRGVQKILNGSKPNTRQKQVLTGIFGAVPDSEAIRAVQHTEAETPPRETDEATHMATADTSSTSAVGVSTGAEVLTANGEMDSGEASASTVPVGTPPEHGDRPRSTLEPPASERPDQPQRRETARPNGPTMQERANRYLDEFPEAKEMIINELKACVDAEGKGTITLHVEPEYSGESLNKASAYAYLARELGLYPRFEQYRPGMYTLTATIEPRTNARNFYRNPDKRTEPEPEQTETILSVAIKRAKPVWSAMTQEQRHELVASGQLSTDDVNLLEHAIEVGDVPEITRDQRYELQRIFKVLRETPVKQVAETGTATASDKTEAEVAAETPSPRESWHKRVIERIFNSDKPKTETAEPETAPAAPAETGPKATNVPPQSRVPTPQQPNQFRDWQTMAESPQEVKTAFERRHYYRRDFGSNLIDYINQMDPEVRAKRLENLSRRDKNLLHSTIGPLMELPTEEAKRKMDAFSNATKDAIWACYATDKEN